jgi:hypothetical protein
MRARSLPSLAVPAIVLAATVGAKVQLALTRYVDADEFAHLHWSWLLASGRIPFRDYFFHFFPLFHAATAPLFFLMPQGPEIILAARIGTVIAAIVTAILVFGMARHLTKSALWGIVAALLYMAVPVTFDKSFEYRPDTLMTTLAVAAAALLVSGRNRRPEQYLMAGFLASASVLVTLKSAAVIPAIVFLGLEPDFGRTVKNGVLMALGAAIPVLGTFWYLTNHDVVVLGWQSIIDGSSLLKQGEGAFSPLLTLSPLPYLYRQTPGVSWPWLFGTGLWLLSVAGAVVTLGKDRRMGLFLLLWIAGCILFLLGFPTPFTQYFILPSAAAAVAAIVPLSMIPALFPKNRTVVSAVLAMGITLAAGYSVYQQTTDRLGPGMGHDEQFKVIETVLSVTKPQETFYDMTGSYVYRPDGYYICCNIYSQFSFALPFPVPSLSESLVKNDTRFIILDRRGAAFWHPYPADKLFLFSTYVPSRYPKIYVPGLQYRCQDASCTQVLLSGDPAAQPSRSLKVTFPGKYQVITDPPDQRVIVGNRDLSGGVGIDFAAGTYGFQVNPAVTSFTFRLDR